MLFRCRTSTPVMRHGHAHARVARHAAAALPAVIICHVYGRRLLMLRYRRLLCCRHCRRHAAAATPMRLPAPPRRYYAHADVTVSCFTRNVYADMIFACCGQRRASPAWRRCAGVGASSARSATTRRRTYSNAMRVYTHFPLRHDALYARVSLTLMPSR